MLYKINDIVLTEIVQESKEAIRPYLIINIENGIYKGIPITNKNNKSKSLMPISKKYGLYKDDFLLNYYKNFYFEDIINKIGEVSSDYLNKNINIKELKSYDDIKFN